MVEPWGLWDFCMIYCLWEKCLWTSTVHLRSKGSLWVGLHLLSCCS